MRPLARKTVDTRANGLETRVDTLERRIIPPQGWAWAQGAGPAGVQTLPSGQFVNPGVGGSAFVSTSDDHIFTHLPITTTWNVGATSNIDGSLVILQRGIYAIFGYVQWDNSPLPSTSFFEVEIVTCYIDDPTGTPVADTPFQETENVGSLASINARAFGTNIDGDKQFSYIHLDRSSTSFFEPVAVKVHISFSGTAPSWGVSGWGLTILQITPLLCRQGNVPFITNNGIPSDWEDDADCG